MTQPLVFISYSQQDEAEKEQLLAHLNVLRQSGGIDVWSEDRISYGSDREAAISAAMAEAKVAILLLSANFFSADDLIEQVVPQLRARQA
ncbi:MAG: TIR domain-containing protein, partial [Anaerolineae bacterium]|nr:TIR domain-containing protein [Anaerolineae bacterium]